MKLIPIFILAVSSVAVQAEESIKIDVPMVECLSHARELAKKGFNIQEIELGSTHIVMFQTRTHHVTTSCRWGESFMTVKKFTNSEMATMVKEVNSRTSDIAKKAGI